MAECDPFQNKINVHGVEICFLDLTFATDRHKTMKKIMEAIYQKNPAIDLHLAERHIWKRYNQWLEQRANKLPRSTPR